MFNFILLIGILLISNYYFNNYLKYLENVKKLLGTGKDLLLKDIILFSNEELARNIKKSFKKGAKDFKIIYFNDKYVIFNKTQSKAHICESIEYIQDSLIKERYNSQSSNNSAIDDSIDQKILDIWLDYGYNRKYKTIFKRELNNMLESGEISDSTFNIMYKRFFKLNRDEYSYCE